LLTQGVSYHVLTKRTLAEAGLVSKGRHSYENLHFHQRLTVV